MSVQDTSYPLTATIANGQTTSSTLTLGRQTLVGLQMPAAFTGTNVSFEGSWDGNTWGPVHDHLGDEVVVPVAASQCVALLPSWMFPWSYVRIVSGSSEAAAREIKCMTAPV